MGYEKLVLLYFLAYSLLQVIKKTFSQTIVWENVVMFFLGGLLSLAYSVDILAYIGLPVEIPWVSYVMNFVVLGTSMTEGGGLLHDLFKRAAV